jgi:hypothetical protein
MVHPLLSEKTVTLDYAGPIDVIERMPEAEALVLSDSLDKFRDLFATTKEAAIYFGRFQSARFAPQTVDRVCKGCDRATDDVVVIRWFVEFTLRFNEFSINTRGYQLWIDTYHSLCDSCLHATQNRVRRHRLSIAAAVTLALLGVAYLFWSGYDPPWARFLKDQLGIYFYAPPIALIAVAIVLVAIRDHRARRQLPAALRRIVASGTFSSIRKKAARVRDNVTRT